MGAKVTIKGGSIEVGQIRFELARAIEEVN
jgi:hypothetical protein